MKNWKRVLLAFGLVLVTAGVVWASGGGEGGSSKLLNLFWRALNFFLVVFVIWKLIGKRIGEFFSGRQYQIETDLKDLDSRKAEAEAKLQQVEESIANLETESEKILASAREQGEVLKQNIVEKAEKTAAQIKAQAKVSAQQESKLAVEAIRAEMADQVVAAAEAMVKSKLTKKQHENLINDYLTEVVLN